jgi:UDPglucose--hexose-1-phosphate uridylyltransferase
VPNRYPALVPDEEGPADDAAGSQTRANGFHEVIIETTEHGRRFSAFSHSHMQAVLSTYRDRVERLNAAPGVRSVILFRNDGRAAGASQEHPHAQILGLPLVPDTLACEIAAAEKHFQERQGCLSCDLLARERRDARRVVAANEDFVVLAAFAPRFPCELWIVPTAHGPDFSRITLSAIRNLAFILGETLRALESMLGPFPYNLILQTAPTSASGAFDRFFHWRLEIVPRFTVASGFELATSVFIVSLLPEQAAAGLRQILNPARDRQSAELRGQSSESPMPG